MASTEQAVGLLAKMYERRKQIKSLIGEDKYREKIPGYIAALKKVMQSHGLDEIKAVLILCEDQEIKDNEVARLMVVCAALEISES